jgi:hypothetical protein
VERTLVTLAALAILCASTAPEAVAMPAQRPRSVAGAAVAAREKACPRYESLMRSAAEALRRGNQPVALEQLREARRALDDCSRSGSREKAVASRPRDTISVDA